MRLSEQLVQKPLNLQLWFGDILVADLLDVTTHQGTWFAVYHQILVPEQGPQQRRLCDFIAFCEEWHQRLKRGQNPDARQFDPYTDVIKTSTWRVSCPDGTELTMSGAPLFVEGEASWNHPVDGPSRELAARAVWSRLTGQGT